MKYGYIRVSTREQDETRQIEALKKVGVSIDNIFVDKSTGTTFVGRDSWFKLLATVVIGDTIVIKELDRLGRNNKEVKETFELVNKKGVFLEFLEQPLLNTYGKSEIERELLQPLILHLLGYFAEKENEKRKTRQREAYDVLPRDEKGRIISRKKNKPVGRENAFDNMTADQRKAIELLHTKVISLKECKDLTGYSVSTIYKIRRMLFTDIPKRTGRGLGTEVRITDYLGNSLLHELEYYKDKLNQFGNYNLGNDIKDNNYGELYGLYLALLLANQKNIKKISGDSSTVINDWKTGKPLSNKLNKDILDLIEKVRTLRNIFEMFGGEIHFIPGGINPADLGFHEE